MSYVLLESSRIDAQNENESNFHIFYSLLGSSTKILLKDIIDLHLDTTKYYSVSYTYILIPSLTIIKLYTLIYL